MNFLPMTEMGNRAGSDVDRDNLKKTLRFMGFKEDHIIVENDLPYQSMIKLLSKGNNLLPAIMSRVQVEINISD